MRCYGAMVWCCVLALVTGCGAEPVDRVGAIQQASTNARPAVIFDNDMDFDDTAALAYLARLHKAGEIDLRLVSITNAGAGLPGRGIRHARCLLDRFGIPDVPVVDSSTPGTHPFPALLRFAIDLILFDLTSDCQASVAPSAVSSEQAIVDVLEGADRPVDILVTGNITNVAAALDLAEAQNRNIDGGIGRVWFQGGAIGPTAGGLCCGLEAIYDQTQTFNVWADQLSAQAVLDALHANEVTLVGGNATRNVPIRSEYVAELLAEADTPEASWVASVVSHPVLQGAIAQGLPVFWWDPLAAIALTRPGVVAYDNKRMTILVEEGPAVGRSVEVGPQEDGSYVRFATDADSGAFEALFLEGLNTPL